MDPRAAWNAVECLARADGCIGREEAKQHRRLARALADVLQLPSVRMALDNVTLSADLEGLRAAEQEAVQAFEAGASYQHAYGRGRWEKTTETLLDDGPDHWHVRHWRRNSAQPKRAWYLDVERNEPEGMLYKAGNFEEGTPPSVLLWEPCDPEEETAMPSREQLRRHKESAHG